MPEQNQPPVDSTWNFIKTKFNKLDKNNAKKYLAEFCKFSFCATVLVYLVSTVTLLLRNLSIGIPFSPLSITQAAVITVYVSIFACSYIGAEHFIRSLWASKSSHPHKYRFAAPILLIAVNLLLIATAILAFAIDSLASAFFLLLLFIVIPCTFLNTNKNRMLKTIAWLSFASIVLTWSLPISIGGLRSQKVEYCSTTNTTPCQEYDYYGVVDDMMIFEDQDYIILIPVGDGIIKYQEPSLRRLTKTLFHQNAEP